VGAPTDLAKTVKGWTLGSDVEARNATHQIKKMTCDQLKVLRLWLRLDDVIPEEVLDADDPPLPPALGLDRVPPPRDRRRALDGPLPSRSTAIRRDLVMPPNEPFTEFDARRAGRVDDDGVHPTAAQPGPHRGLRPPHGADHP
jgi:pyruvate dehydrogenase E1 component